MKNLILNMLLLVITVTTFSVNANSCNMNYSKTRCRKSCDKPVNHTNRKMRNCNKKNTCAKKDVRMNKLAKREYCN